MKQGKRIPRWLPDRTRFSEFCMVITALLWCGCVGRVVDVGLLLPAREFGVDEAGGLSLVARIAHVSDTQIIDEETPGRFAGAGELVRFTLPEPSAFITQRSCCVPSSSEKAIRRPSEENVALPSQSSPPVLVSWIGEEPSVRTLKRSYWVAPSQRA